MSRQKEHERERGTLAADTASFEGADAYGFMIGSIGEATVVAGCDGTIFYGNSRLAEILDLPFERIIGANLYDFFQRGDRQKLESTLTKGKKGSGREAFTVINGSGASLPVYVSGTKVTEGTKDAVCLVIADVEHGVPGETDPETTAEAGHRTTGEAGHEPRREEATSAEADALIRDLREKIGEHERRELRLGKSEEYLRLLIENGTAITMVLKEDGAIAYAAGSGIRKTFGCTAKGCVGRNFFDLVDPDDRAWARERILSSTRYQGQQASLEVRVRARDDGWRTVELTARNQLRDPSLEGIVLELRDVTGKKETQDKLKQQCEDLERKVSERTGELRGAYERLESEIKAHRESEEERVRLTSAMERGGDCVIILDKEGTIQYVNPAFEKVSLYSREEVTGLPLDRLKGPDSDVSTWSGMWESLNSGKPWTGRVTSAKRDGSPYDVERTVYPVRDKTGEVSNFVCAERDPAERAGLEAELRSAQKMQAIGTLAGGIAHDFNNILAAMIGFTELAMDDVNREGPATRHLEQVRKAGYRGRELVKQILTFSRQGEQEKKPVQVAPIVREVINLMRASLPATVDVRSSIETEEGIILADPVQINQLLINLCTNAGQAMKGGKGTLEVRLADFEVDEGKDAPHPDMSPGSYVRISVADTGPGVDRLIRDRIFEPFFTTRQQTEGAGMGLSVVYGIVKSHLGAVTVSETEQEGAVFTVYFRKLKETQAPSPRVEKTHATRGKRRILFVDDEEALVEIAKQMLERLGYEVVAEKDSIRAFKQFQRDPERFDLVITDQTMPNMTGIELARKVMSIRKDIPVILCTGFSEVISPEAAKAMGIREFVMKPIVKKEMAATINRVIDGEGGSGK